jgi:hypothetical protein
VWTQVLEEGKLFLVIKENLSISCVNPGAPPGFTHDIDRFSLITRNSLPSSSTWIHTWYWQIFFYNQEQLTLLEHLDSHVILTDFLLYPGTAYPPRAPGFTRDIDRFSFITRNSLPSSSTWVHTWYWQIFFDNQEQLTLLEHLDSHVILTDFLL